MKKKIICIGCNSCQAVWNFRANLIKAIQNDGYRVVVLAPKDEYAAKLESMGVQVVDLPMKMNKNPIEDMVLAVRFFRILYRLRPSAYLGFTAKPNIYGSICAHLLSIPSISNVSGLGYGFIAGGMISRLLKALYRVAFANSSLVFFQNQDDADLFLCEGIIRHQRVDLLPGSGVDLARFELLPRKCPEGRKFRFLMVARVLRDKGIFEYVEAARIILAENKNAEFWLLGSASIDNPAAVSPRTISNWVSEGCITHIHFQDDVRTFIESADCVVLPSYREGTPRVLLEAAACGRAVITSDAIGCRNAVIDGETGYLCSTRDANDLASKMRQMLELPFDRVTAFGRNGRVFMQNVFDERIVIGKYREAIRLSIEV